MKIIKKLGYSTLGLASLYIAYLTGTGDILNYINFADPLNELAFCVGSIMTGIGLLYIGLSSDKVSCSSDLDWEWHNESI